jgi:hypothetical protein
MATRNLAAIPNLADCVEHRVEIHLRETAGGQDDPALIVPVWPMRPPAPRSALVEPREAADDADLAGAALLIGGCILAWTLAIFGFWQVLRWLL